MTPSVLFVCVRNGSMSQVAAGLMRKAASGRVIAHSAGTDPGKEINALSAEALAEVGVDIVLPPWLHDDAGIESSSSASDVLIGAVSSAQRSSSADEVVNNMLQACSG